ncbi:MAG: glutamine synthetase family protein [Pseudomonadota bacterium]
MNDELQRFLARYPDIEAVQVFITDPSGVARGKTVSRGELDAIYSHGRNVAGSILGLDITGKDVEATGLVWETGDADKLCRPVPGTLLPTPWFDRTGLDRTGQLMLSMYELDGTPAPADPRHCLKRAVQRVQALGLTPVLACELEFYLLRRLADGQLVPAGPEAPTRLGERDRIDAYGLTRLDDLAPVFADVFAAARAQGLPVGTLMSEYAPGQYEITLQHRGDALQAVDEAVHFKRLLRGVAARHGLIATFMAKPFTARAGSGAHLHVSASDAAGNNAFAAEDLQGTPLLRHAIGGLMATAAESFLVFAPNGNSYRRYQQDSYAPVRANWGVNNRSVSLRVPAGPASSRHVEHRFCGADVNLYLAAATVLAGVAQGIEQQLDPGPAVTGNGYAKAVDSGAAGRVLQLPQTWHESLTRAAQSPFLQATLGADFHRIYLAIKTQECAAWTAEVTATDLAWYLRNC